ncbi:MAG: PAS domain S-box protein [Nitrospira sp.]|nr:MAG: PAS domain S-box protein [Nitrospira sp.]
MSQRVSLPRVLTFSILSVGIVSGTIGLAAAYWHATQSLRSSVGLTFQELARQSAEKTSLWLGKEVEWIERFSVLPELHASLAGIGRTQGFLPFEQWRDGRHPYFHSFALVRADGQLVGGQDTEQTRNHYRHQPWWPILFAEARAWAGPLTIDGEGHGHWEVAVPIGRPGEPVRGALKVIIGTDRILSSILSTRIGQTGHMMVVDEEGRVLACSLLPPTRHQAVPAITMQKGASAGPRWLPVREDSHGGGEGIIGVAPITLPKSVAQAQAWYVLMQQDPEETFAPLRGLVEKLTLFWIGTIGFIAWLRWGLARRIVRPVTALIRRMDSLGAGRTPSSLPVDAGTSPSGIVEIDALAASFDDLARRLAFASQAEAQYVRRLEQANVDLAASEELYRLLWNHSVDTKILLDPHGHIRDMNRRGELTLGQPRAAVMEHPLTELVTDPDRLRLSAALERVRKTGDEVPAGTMRVPTPAGELTMEVDVVPLMKAGRIDSIMVQLSDLTEQQQLERQLVRSERLASLSQFASMFAHDIRNPLAGIKKTLEWLGGRPEMAQDLPRRCLEDLRFTTDLLLGMINDMLDVYQESYAGLPLSTSSVSLSRVLKDVTHLFRPEAEAQQVRFSVQMPAEEVRIVGDGRRLQRVLINVIHNALKYSPPQGTITITLRQNAPSGVGGLDHEGGRASMVTFSVEDDGPGIAPEDLSHLFELFFRKKDGQDYRIGRGLGLHFCRLVVEAHGGLIRASNRPEGGAIFTVTLPVTQEQPCLSRS